MSERSKRRSTFSPSEWSVMKVLWRDGPMALGEIYAKLSPAQDWAYSTVKTLVRRLAAKGCVSAQRVGSSCLYRAATPERKAVKSAIREFSERVLNGLLSPFVAYFAEEENLLSEDVAQLEKIIRQHRRKGVGGDGSRRSS